MTGIPAPRDTSTVILMRDNPDSQTQGFEVLMVRRSSRSSFEPGANVFPGGRVEKTIVCRSGKTAIARVACVAQDRCRFAQIMPLLLQAIHRRNVLFLTIPYWQILK